MKLLIKNAKVPVKSQSSPYWQELSAVSRKNNGFLSLHLGLCRMGTKSSCQAKCFILIALVSSPYTLSSGRTSGYSSPNSSRNYLDPSLPSVSFSGGRNIRTEAGLNYTKFLFTRYLNNSLHKTQGLVTH